MTVQELLAQICTQTPLPSKLKNIAKRYREGKLGYNSIKRVIEEYSDYTVVLTLKKKCE